MDNMEAMFWVVTLKQANEGSEDAMEMLRQENEKRTEKGQPTVEEELMEIVKRAE